jgi:hypothetical protein
MKKTIKRLSAKMGDVSRMTSVQAGGQAEVIVRIAIGHELQILYPWLNVERTLPKKKERNTNGTPVELLSWNDDHSGPGLNDDMMTNPLQLDLTVTSPFVVQYSM